MVSAGAWKRAGLPADAYVLVVDSDPQNLVFMSMIIQRLQYHSCAALGVGNALEIVNVAVPALVIAEFHLKGLSGLDLLQRLRQKETTRAVPVIVMARELTPEIEQQCRGAGASAFLEKPVQANELYEAIHPVIEPGSRRKEVRIKTRLSVTVNDRPLDCVDGECATNLSVNGMYVRTLGAYPENSPVVVSLKLNEQEIRVEARVAYCIPLRDGRNGMWGVGLQFLKTSPRAGEIIRGFINSEVSHGIEPELD